MFVGRVALSGVGVVGLTIFAGPALAACGLVEGQSQMRQALTMAHEGAAPADVKRSYDRQFALGRDQAVADWQTKVRARCPGASIVWKAAQAKSVTECDRAMGGRFTVCVKGVPGP